MGNYGYVKAHEEDRPPDYARTVSALSTADLEDEARLGRGEPAYQAAVQAELAKRRSS